MGRNPEINKNLTKNPFLLLDSGKIKCYNIARTKEAGNNRLFRNSENDFLMIFLSRQVYLGRVEPELEASGSITMISGRHGKFWSICLDIHLAVPENKETLLFIEEEGHYNG